MANLCIKTKLEGDVFLAVLIIIDFHFVKHIRIEREIIWAIRRLEEWVNIQNHGDAVRMVKADERVPVGDICGAVERGDRRFAMAGRKQAAREQQRERRKQSKRQAKAIRMHGYSSGVKCLVTTESLVVRREQRIGFYAEATFARRSAD